MYASILATTCCHFYLRQGLYNANIFTTQCRTQTTPMLLPGVMHGEKKIKPSSSTSTTKGVRHIIAFRYMHSHCTCKQNIEISNVNAPRHSSEPNGLSFRMVFLKTANNLSIRRKVNSDTAPEIVELRRQKHRDAQARYRAKNAEELRLKRFLRTEKGKKHKINLLHSSDSPYDTDNKDAGGYQEKEE